MTYPTVLRRLLCETSYSNYGEPAVSSPAGRSKFHADYYAITPSGTRGRFQRSSNLWSMQGGASETAVKVYLQQFHPRCEIQILDLRFE